MSLEISEKPFLLKPVLFGQIDYVNCLPITLPFLRRKPANLELVMDTPGQLNRAYGRHEIELGAMSAHYYLEDGGFKLFDRLCIASRGAVGSVLLFSRRPLSELCGSRIALSKSSATSNNLVKVLLAEELADGNLHYLDGIEFVTDLAREADALPTDSEFDGCVVIGDNALAADLTLKESGQTNNFVRKDLGQWWFERFKLPMVFGVWAARKTWCDANVQDFESLNHFLYQCLDHGLTDDYQQVLVEAERRTGLSTAALDSYFKKELDYSFSAEHHQGLDLFRQLCLKYGLL